jgi:hypothetical protein
MRAKAASAESAMARWTVMEWAEFKVKSKGKSAKRLFSSVEDVAASVKDPSVSITTVCSLGLL